MAPQLGPGAVDTIRRACDIILGIESDGLTADNHTRYTAILGSIADRITFPSSRILALKHALWLLRKKIPGIPHPLVGVSTLSGLRSLAESWRPDGPDHDGVHKAEQIARYLCHMRRAEIDANPMSAYACAHNLLANLGGFNPHKLYYGPQSVTI